MDMLPTSSNLYKGTLNTVSKIFWMANSVNSQHFHWTTMQHYQMFNWQHLALELNRLLADVPLGANKPPVAHTQQLEIG